MNIIYTLSIMLLIFSSVEFTHEFNYLLLKNAFKKNSGSVESLPAEVISLNALITKNNLKSFNLAGILNDHPLLHQRAVEYTYPTRLDSNAKDVFTIKGTPLPGRCQLINQQENVEHYVCE